MRWATFNNASHEYEDDRVTVLDRAEQRPVLAVFLVLVCWSLVVFAVTTLYGLFL
jgi:hypothetical protein